MKPANPKTTTSIQGARDDESATHHRCPLQRFLQVDGLVGCTPGDHVMPGDVDGDTWMAGITEELMRSPGERQPIRVLIHEDASLEDGAYSSSSSTISTKPLPCSGRRPSVICCRVQEYRSGEPVRSVTTRCNTQSMASSKTRAVAARIPIHLADRIRNRAQLRGVTVSEVVGACIRESLGECREDRNTEHSDQLEAVR